MTLITLEFKFWKPLKCTPPRRIQPMFVPCIQTKQCGCCSPLVLKATTENSTFEINDIPEQTPVFENILNVLQIPVKVVKGKTNLRNNLIELLYYMEMGIA